MFELCDAGRDQEPQLVCTGYRLSAWNFERMDDVFPRNEVYVTEAEAQELAQWNAVTDISEEEWQRAVGDRDDKDIDIEECELSRCCAIVSSIRDLLLECKKYKGLIERDRRKLRTLLGQHEHPAPQGQRPPILDKILGRLNLLDAVKL